MTLPMTMPMTTSTNYVHHRNYNHYKHHHAHHNNNSILIQSQ